MGCGLGGGCGGGSSVADGKAGQGRGAGLAGDEGDDRAKAAAVEDGVGGAFGALEGDGFAAEVEVFGVGAGGDKEGVAGLGGVDGGLDGWLVCGDADGLLGVGRGDEGEGGCEGKEKPPEERVGG